MLYDSAGTIVAALQAGRITAVELLEATIARITAVDPTLNAIVVRDFDRARAAAQAADAARARGDDRPLLGVPVTVKEAIDVAGLPTTWGLPDTHGTPAARDAVVVERLKAAGAIVLGKTNVPVMLSDWQTSNPVYGTTNNPWDVSRTPGGSSGGAAAALASGLTFLECGSDLAGSLRIPASFCGVCAHRPTHDVIPMCGFAPPGTPRDDIMPPVDQSVLGPMARTAADLMLALDILAGPDVADATAYALRLPPPRAGTVAGVRVLIVDEHPLVPTAATIRAALASLGTALEQSGCVVGRQSGSLPDLRALSILFIELLMAFVGADLPPEEYAAAVARAAAVSSAPDDLATAATRGMAMTHRDWIQADRRRAALAAQWRQLFTQWDVVLCPTASTVAFPHDARPFDARSIAIDGQLMPYNLLPLWTAVPTPTGQPATTVPIGRDASGLPIGMQIIGPRLEDRTTIAFAGMVEGLTGGFVPPPSLAATR